MTWNELRPANDYSRLATAVLNGVDNLEQVFKL